MAAISQMTFLNAFSWMRSYVFPFKFHWSLFPRVQLTIAEHWFRKWLGTEQVTKVIISCYLIDLMLLLLNQYLPESQVHICSARGSFVKVTSWCGNAFCIAGPFEENPPVSSGFLHKGPVMPIFDIPFVVSLNKLLIKQWNCRWFEMPWHSCDITTMSQKVTFVWAYSWWRHPMETFSTLLVLCAGNSSVSGEFPSQRPVTRSFDVFFNLHRNKWLSKQWRRRWFEMQWRPLWRHCNVLLSAHSGHRVLSCPAPSFHPSVSLSHPHCHTTAHNISWILFIFGSAIDLGMSMSPIDCVVSIFIF